VLADGIAECKQGASVAISHQWAWPMVNGGAPHIVMIEVQSRGHVARMAWAQNQAFLLLEKNLALPYRPA
jgi:hypothetical protein